MMEFLEDSKTNDELLFQLYVQLKKYDKAWPLADKLYKESGSINFLGQSAIFEYESAKDKNDKKMQKSVIKKLRDVIKLKRDGIYLNYLGYLLIDHDIDVKEGIVFVREALKQEPNSAYYLDSLAWGYYKLSNCERAKSIMDMVSKMKGGDNPEVVKHIKIIDKCYKKSRKTKKKGKKAKR
jgi:tetratricopeptide (TPR) repeat protein